MATTHGHDHEFKVGERGFDYYSMKPGTVETEPDGEGWFDVRHDDGGHVLLNNERFVTLEVARRYGYEVPTD